MSYSAVVLDFNVNESTICSKEGVVKQKHKQSKFIYWMDEKMYEQMLQEPTLHFP